MTIVNDVHSRLNATRVTTIEHPHDIDDLLAIVRRARDSRAAIAVCGGRHAMGAQQFARDALLIDMSAMNRPIAIKTALGLLEIQAGATWPDVIGATHALQPGISQPWTIRQKQTGADCLTLGGALASNVHGRGLLMRPIVDDVERFTLITAEAQLITCSRTENPQLFSLVIGGYGLFGVVATVTLRLQRRTKLRRLVDILDIDDAITAVQRRASEGCLYGDFQYAIDPRDDSFLRRGVCACYQPVDDDTPISDHSADLSRDNWVRLLQLAHDDKPRAFGEYARHYLQSHGRVYSSDTMQLSTYLPSYSEFLALARARARARARANPRHGAIDESLVIGEQFVPVDSLVDFLVQARRVLRSTGVEDIYGTIRSILADECTFLRWAKRDYACVIFNLRTPHTSAGIERTMQTFRLLNDASIASGGSFYLTYHRAATREQIEQAYPEFEQFLALKRQLDPDDRFTSNWFTHYAALFDRTPSQQIAEVLRG
jgi:FAD/FMN-containing dehydrogenase